MHDLCSADDKTREKMIKEGNAMSSSINGVYKKKTPSNNQNLREKRKYS